MEKSSVHEISILTLGTTAKEINKNWQKLKKEKVEISLMENPNIDIYKKVDSLKQQDMMEFFINILEKIEQKNREIAKKRQAEGIQRAREEGVQLGRRPLEIPKDFDKTYALIQEKKIRVTTAAKLLDVDYKTIKKWIASYESKLELVKEE